MSIKVAILGHSQVPQTFHVQNSEISIFRRSGACIHHFDESPLRDILEDRFDLVFLFLGGNDIRADLYDCKPVIVGLKGILLRLKEISKEVRFVAIERRHYSVNNRFGVENAQYEHDRRRINNNLRKFCGRQNIRIVNTTTRWFSDHLGKDGVHFATEAQRELKQKFTNVINLCREQAIQGGSS